ncbi:hypothetical protein ABW20_dc0100555 [Dactylellina cionopaga]|nr:hypothetical protein ABW20_dc0100555 [Dactylellina cionopaga]
MDVPVNGSSIIRDVCLFMQLPIIKASSIIDYSQGENGCNDVLGADCVSKLKEFLAMRYQERTAENGTMDCTSTMNLGSWHQSIYDICPVYKEKGGSGFQFNKLIPSDHETGSPLHGDENGYWIAIGTPRNESEATAEEQYDEVSQYVFTYSFVSGPEYESPSEAPNVEMVCVKAEDPVAGSRGLPNAANILATEKGVFSLIVALMIFSVLLL